MSFFPQQDNNDKEKLISLNEAEKYCFYSADYLKLRARQGKLKAQKIGRMWVTTKEWLEEYIREMKDYKIQRKKKKETKGIKKEQEEQEPQKNFFRRTQFFLPKLEFKFPRVLVRTTPLVLVIVLIMTGVALGKPSQVFDRMPVAKELYKRTIFQAQEINKKTAKIIDRLDNSLVVEIQYGFTIATEATSNASKAITEGVENFTDGLFPETRYVFAITKEIMSDMPEVIDSAVGNTVNFVKKEIRIFTRTIQNIPNAISANISRFFEIASNTVFQVNKAVRFVLNNGIENVNSYIRERDQEFQKSFKLISQDLSFGFLCIGKNIRNFKSNFRNHFRRLVAIKTCDVFEDSVSIFREHFQWLSGKIDEKLSQSTTVLQVAVKNIFRETKDFAAGIVNVGGIARARELFAQKLTTEELCLEQNGEKICITKKELKELLDKNQIGKEENNIQMGLTPHQSSQDSGDAGQVEPINGEEPQPEPETPLIKPELPIEPPAEPEPLQNLDEQGIEGQTEPEPEPVPVSEPAVKTEVPLELELSAEPEVETPAVLEQATEPISIEPAVSETPTVETPIIE